MTNRRFFVVVWKVNALIILAIGVLAAGALVFAGIIALRDLTRTRHATNVVNVGNDRSARTTTRLGTFTKVPGTEVFRAPLHIEQEYELSVVSKETTSVQNYLFYDSVSGRSYWLSDGTRVLFAETHELPHRDYGDRTPVTAFVYEIVEHDTNGDDRLTPADVKNVSLSNPAGTRLWRVAANVSEVHAADMTGAGSALIIYSASGQVRAATVDVLTGTVTRNLPVVPNPK